MITINIDRADARNVAELIELYLPQACRDFYDAGDELERAAKEAGG